MTPKSVYLTQYSFIKVALTRLNLPGKATTRRTVSDRVHRERQLTVRVTVCLETGVACPQSQNGKLLQEIFGSGTCRH